MRLSTSLVAVKRITPTEARSTFLDDELEQSAKLILEAEGIINPIILRRTSLDSYEVVEGNFEYYAAARAREIDPRKGEMIGAFILEEDKEEAILEQIQLLRKLKSSSEPEDFKIKEDWENRITTRLQSYLNQQIQEIQNERQEDRKWLEAKLEEFEKKVSYTPKPQEVKSESSNEKKPYDIFNEAQPKELIKILINAGLPKSKAEKVAESVKEERNLKQFSSLGDVVERVKIKQGKKNIKEIKGISSDTMLRIINNGSSVN